MKKLLLVLTLFAAVSFSFAQTRTVDWSTEALISSDTMKSTPSGTTFTWTVKMKNNGPDTVKVGDTIWYQMAVLNGSNAIYAYPSSGVTIFGIVLTQMKPGDTLVLTKSVASGLNINPSANLTLGVVTFVRGLPTLAFEGSSTSTNNQKTKPILWQNIQGWSVGVTEVPGKSAINVYPNPASEMIHFTTDINTAKTISIMDITGREIENMSITSEDMAVNLENYQRGVYLYQIKGADGVIKSGKFNVTK